MKHCPSGWALDASYNPQVFLALPGPEELQQNWSSADHWAGELTETLTAGLADDDGVTQRLHSLLLRIIHADWTESDGSRPSHTFIHAPAGEFQLLVTHLVWWDDGGITENRSPHVLRELVTGSRTDLVEPPIVDDFESGLGIGARALRYRSIPDEDGSTALWADARYAWHLPKMQSVLELRVAITTPSRLLQALDDLDAFARGLHLVPSQS